MSTKKSDPDRFLDLLRGSNDRCIGFKRKLTNMIMDDIDTEHLIPYHKSFKSARYPVEAFFETQSQQNYKEENVKNQTKFFTEKRNKISIDMIFEDENSQSQFKKKIPPSREKYQIQSEDEIEESDDLFEKGFVKPKNMKYDIDDILTEENLNANDSKSFMKGNNNLNKTENEFQIQNFEFDKISNRKKLNNTEKLDELIGDSSPLVKKKFFSTISNNHVEEIKDDYLDSFRIKNLKAKPKNTANIDELLKDEQEFQLAPKENKKQDNFLLASLAALEEIETESETHLNKKISINDPNFDSQEKYTQNKIEIKDDLNFDSQVQHGVKVFNKTNWLEEINLKLDETSILNNANQSNILANSSNFLSQIENKKKKIKFIKNGYAEKLEKLLIRQKSSINIIKHHLNKKSAPERTQKSKNLTNVVKLIPFFKQNVLATKFTLIHAFNVNDLDGDNFDLSFKNICYILLSNDVVDYSSYFDTDIIQSKYLINIYPPWRKFVMKDSKKTIYFSTNLIEIIPVKNNEIYYEAFNIPKKEFNSIVLNALQCPSCLDIPESDHCSLNLFDTRIYQKALNGHFKSKEKQKNNIFYTQTASEFLTQTSSINTQYLRANSILDALENIGYYGFANFKATVQRIGLVKNKSMLLYHSQRTQTQHDDNQFKRQIVISDKVGLFALIVFPLNLDSYLINESSEYEFNSIKFVEKRTLCNRDNFDLNEQITFLCKKLNLKRENDAKKSPKSIQRFIYIFEFISVNQSHLTELGNSKEFIPPDIIFSLKELPKSNIELFWFNLYDIILFKIQFDSLSNEYLIFFAEKSHFLSDIDFEIKRVKIKCTFQIKDKKILTKLDENYILFENNFEDHKSIIYLKNVSLDNSKNENSIIFSSFSSVEVADPSKLNALAKASTYNFQHKCLKTNHFEKKLPLWRTDLNLKVFDFGLIEGTVINICEDNCCFDFYCQICQNNQTNLEFTNQSQLNFDKSIKSWICDVCRNASDEPLLKIQIQVVLNCVGISRKIHLKLHSLTIKKFIRTDCYLEKFIQDEPIDFNVSTLIDKRIGPSICFINKINETQIFAEEILLDK